MKVDAKTLLALLVLMARDVDAVDALGGVFQFLAKEFPFFPFSDAQLVVGRGVEGEPVQNVILPETFLVTPVPLVHDSLSTGL